MKNAKNKTEQVKEVPTWVGLLITVIALLSSLWFFYDGILDLIQLKNWSASVKLFLSLIIVHLGLRFTGLIKYIPIFRWLK